jgi:dipeptidyl aminopeptidase/acylaminoacyl peptidase
MLRSTLLPVMLMFATVAVAQSPAAPPDTSRVFTAEKMWALKRLGDPAITPDGKTAVVPVTTYDIKENKGLTDLWLIPVAGGAARQLTADKASDTQPTVSPNGKWIAFVSKRGEDSETQIYVIDYARGIDILRYDPEAKAPTTAELDASWLANAGVVNPLAETERQLCVLYATNQT